jgi:O-antigen ligase
MAIKSDLTRRKISIPSQTRDEIDRIEKMLEEIAVMEKAHRHGPVKPLSPVLAAAIPMKTVPVQPDQMPGNWDPGTGKNPVAAIRNAWLYDRLWTVLLIGGLLLTVATIIITSFGDVKLTIYFIGGFLGIFLAVFIFLHPELGGYLLLVTSISNLSDIFTESGLPSINKPVVALTLVCVLANQILRTGRVNFSIKLTKVEWALIIFYLVVIGSFYVASDKAAAWDLINGFTRNLVILYCILVSLNTPEKWKRGLWIFMITASFLAMFGAFQMVTGNSDFTFFGLAKKSILGQLTDEGVLRYGGPMGESNMWAQILVGALPLMIYRIINEKSLYVKFFTGCAAMFTSMAIYYTSSRGAFVTALILIVIIALERRITLTKALISLGVSAIIVSMLPQTYINRMFSLVNIISPQNQYSVSDDESILGRLTVMKVGLAMFQDRPFLGVGVGNYENQYWDYAPKQGLEAGTIDSTGADTTRQPHNLYIELMAETGLFGIMTFITFYLMVLKGLVETRWELISYEKTENNSTWVTSVLLAVFSYMVSGLFLHGIFYIYIWVFIVLGMTAIHLFQGKRIAQP